MRRDNLDFLPTLIHRQYNYASHDLSLSQRKLHIVDVVWVRHCAVFVENPSTYAYLLTPANHAYALWGCIKLADIPAK